ncbi:MAG TPA: hypothetical protein VK668_12700 [Mucilaginibacter sp.]|nr:hypothetical protein [Mucilaginibacter sp.]
MESEKVKDKGKKDHNASNKKIAASTSGHKTTEKHMVILSDNDSQGELADEKASNKGQGPAGENL